METPVLVRRTGEAAWRRATTINISRTGVLMQTDGFPLHPETPVEVVVALPIFGDLAPARIQGTGRIVRVVESPGSPDSVVAAHIEEYRLQDEDVRADVLPA